MCIKIKNGIELVGLGW